MGSGKGRSNLEVICGDFILLCIFQRGFINKGHLSIVNCYSALVLVQHEGIGKNFLPQEMSYGVG